MTISSLMPLWFERMVRNGILKPGSSMLEFGPQDCDTPRTLMKAIAVRMVGADAERRICDIYDGMQFKPTGQAALYGLFGITDYKSLDPFDPRGDYKFDLESPVPVFGQFDVVTNFGTSEHVFNIANVFKTAYDLLPVGGIMLNALPAFGDINHGLYNIHPVFYFLLARHSGFEIADIQYVDDITAKTELAKRMDGPCDFETFLPIQFQNMTSEAQLRSEIYERFVVNAAFPGRYRLWPGGTAPSVFDYCFVALRRVSAEEFQPPYQYSEKPISRTFNKQVQGSEL
jgi:hypothetical protein